MYTKNLANTINAILVEQENLLSAIVDPAFLYDLNLNVVSVNSSFIKHYDFNPAGLNVKDVIAMFSCKWLDESRYIMNEQPTVKAIKGEHVSGAIFSIKFKGKESFVESSSGPIYNNGKIIGALTLWHIIDDSIKIQNAFSRSEMLQRRINDHSPTGVIINKNGLIEYANSAALKMLGAKHLLDIEGSEPFQFLHPQHQKQMLKRMENLKSGKLVEEAEQKIIGLDKVVRDVEIKAINISDNENRIIQVFLRDITSEKKKNNINKTLSSIEQVIHRSVRDHDITQKAMEMVAESLECDSAAVSFYYESEWMIKHVYKFPESVKGLIVPVNDEPHALLALNEKKIVLIEDTHTDPRVNHDRLKNWEIRSVIVVPLFTKHEKIGVILFNYHEQKIFNHEEIYFLIRFSTTLSLALENISLFDNLQYELETKGKNEKKLLKLNQTLLALSRSSQALLHAKNETEYVWQICDIITHDCNQALAWVGIIEDNRVIPVSWSGFSKDYLKSFRMNLKNNALSKGPTGMAIKTKKPFVCNNIQLEPGFKPWRDSAIKNGLYSCVSLPLIYQDNVFGVLNLYSNEIGFFTDDEIQLLSELAKYLSQGIFSIRLNLAKKQAEELLRESEEQFRMLTEKSNALICELDTCGNILYSNSKYHDIFGKYVSSSILENCKSEEQGAFLNYLTGKPTTVAYKPEWLLNDKMGNWKWFRCHPSLFNNSKGGQRCSLMLFDISESKLAEKRLKKSARELKELNATKDKFFNIIAHDLKNPFSSLIGASEMLASDTDYDTEINKKLGKVINDSARRGYALLQNLLDWSRSQTGTISFNPDKINLNDLVRDCFDNVKDSAYNKGHQVEIAITNNIELVGDFNMLNTVVRNLIQNAIKFTHNNGIIKVYARKNKKGVTLSIEDNGIGISKENIKKLFRIGIKFSHPGTNKETGTGLGLLLCKEFVEKHGGRIWAVSNEGAGSKFSFTIPLST